MAKFILSSANIFSVDKFKIMSSGEEFKSSKKKAFFLLSPLLENGQNAGKRLPLSFYFSLIFLKESSVPQAQIVK